MRKWSTNASAIAILAVLGLSWGSAATASASTSASAEMGVNSASVTSARNIAKAVVTFRSDMNSLLASYVADYGDRLSPANLEKAQGLIAQADASLVGVQNATARTAQLAAAGAPKAQVLAASRAAEKAFTRSHDGALAALNQITPILQPQLGLFEALRAKRDADSKLAVFAGVGAKITALTKTVSASR